MSAIAPFFQQCDPAKPLKPGDQRYVLPPEGARGERDEIARLTNAIRWSDSPLHLLLAGHRGGGKSTELPGELPGSEHDRVLLYNLSILEYLNSAAWYGVNPAILLLDKFSPTAAPRKRAKAKRAP